MSFLNKVKKGLGTAVDGAKIASNMALIKKDIEHSKIKKSKLFKQLGEIVYNNKEEFLSNESLSEVIESIEALEAEMILLEEKLNNAGDKFSDSVSSTPDVKFESTEDEIVEVKSGLKDTTEKDV